MKKKFAILTGALMTVALSAAIFANKPLTAQEELILKNVEAIAKGERPDDRDPGTCGAKVPVIVGDGIWCVIGVSKDEAMNFIAQHGGSGNWCCESCYPDYCMG